MTGRLFDFGNPARDCEADVDDGPDATIIVAHDFAQRLI